MSSSLEDSPYIAVVDHPPEVAAAELEPDQLLWHGEVEEQERFVDWARSAVGSLLPAATHDALRAFDSGEGPPAILLRGLGVDPNLEGTEAAREPSFKKSGQRSEALVLGVAALFGDTLAVDSQGQAKAAMAAARGETPEPHEPKISIGHLVARQGKSRARVAHDGTPMEGLADLNLHRDGMFDEYGTYNYVGGEHGNVELFLPDKLFLFCNRGDPGGDAQTWLHDMTSLYHLLSDEDRAILSNPEVRPLQQSSRYAQPASQPAGQLRGLSSQTKTHPPEERKTLDSNPC
jgi:hypothetical protein